MAYKENYSNEEISEFRVARGDLVSAINGHDFGAALEIFKTTQDKWFDYRQDGYVMSNMTILHMTVSHVELNEISSYLAQNSSLINQRTSDGSTALLYACKNQNKVIASLLITNGAEVDTKNKDGDSPFINACIYSDMQEVATMIFKIGANPNDEKHEIPALLYAYRNKNYDLCFLLLQKGANPNGFDRQGKTLLMYAAHERNFLFVKEFLKIGGIDINKKNSSQSMTALHIACYTDSIEIIILLLEHGADFNAMSQDMRTPLSILVGNWHLDSLRIVLAKIKEMNLLHTVDANIIDAHIID